MLPFGIRTLLYHCIEGDTQQVISYVTVAMRDIDSGRPNIALLTELDNAVSKVNKRHFFGECQFICFNLYV